MKPVLQVRKRDGRLVEFDESKIADAIYKAALSVGGEDRFFAEELASVVALFIEKTYQDGMPSIEDVQDMVEKVLIETGHAGTAKSFILYREKRGKLREARICVREPVQGELFRPGPMALFDLREERVLPIDAESLGRSLSAESGLSEEMSAEVARAVTERIHAQGIEPLHEALLRRLVDAELVSRGFFHALGERLGVELAGGEVEASIFPKERRRRGRPADRVAGAVLRRYALLDLHPPEVAEAHLSGRIHLRGLATPTSVFCTALSSDALREFGVPGVSGRVRPETVSQPRRFAAWLGRVVRSVGEQVSHGLGLTHFNVLASPLLAGLDYDGLREEAWHVLAELAGIPEMEIGLGVLPPPILAARKARGFGGEALEKTYADFGRVSLRLASAFLEVRGTGEGLGPRSELPPLVLTLGPDALEEPEALKVVARAVGEALAREPLVVVLDREDLPLLGTGRMRARLEDATRLTDTRTLGVTTAARVVVNLPRAAYRAGRGKPEAFVDEVEASADLAIEGLRARARFLARAAAGPDGPLAPFAPALLDLEHATCSLAVTGLNEAVAHVSGEELHESDEALKLGRRVLGCLQLRCGKLREDGFDVAVDAEEDRAVAERFAERDRFEYPALGEEIPVWYTEGVMLRADAPVDLALKLESEGRLGLALRTSTVRWIVAPEDHPSSESVVALLRKVWRNTRVSQIVLGRRG